MKLKISSTTATYAGRTIIEQGNHLADVEFELTRSYNVEARRMVGSERAAIVDFGNASGSFELPVLTDYDTPAEAFAAAVELAGWADTHRSGELAIRVAGTRLDGSSLDTTLTYAAALEGVKLQHARTPKGKTRIVATFSFILA